MTKPIKTLQCLPVGAKFIFRDTSNSEKKRVDFGKYAKVIGRQIAKEFPGYSSVEFGKADDSDSHQETLTMLANLAAKQCKVGTINIHLCGRLENYLKGSKDAQMIDGILGHQNKTVVSNVTSADIHKFNKEIVQGTAMLERRHQKLIRHDRLQVMIDCGILLDNNALSHHLRHFADDRKSKLATIKTEQGKLSSLPEKNDLAFFENYFAE